MRFIQYSFYIKINNKLNSLASFTEIDTSSKVTFFYYVIPNQIPADCPK